jgi:hypothetical protein
VIIGAQQLVVQYSSTKPSARVDATALEGSEHPAHVAEGHDLDRPARGDRRREAEVVVVGEPQH